MSRYLVRHRGGLRIGRRQQLPVLMGDTFLGVIALLLVLWSLPFVVRLLSLGQYAAPVPALLLVAILLLVGRAAFRVHGVLETSLRQTLMGQEDEAYVGKSRPGPPDGDPTG
ncbi:MAG: hypothetical protein Q8P22_08245 [Chloroflexota bacterium]|nr:hypothetical protein [Chloroflexota bacterium]